MSNVLKMAAINSIATLVRAGYSDRHIAAVLHVDRGTVAKYRQENQNPPNAPPGSGGDPPGHELQNPQNSPTGPDSQCEPHRELILQKLEQGLTAQRIYQDLVEDHEFTAKYHSVRRYVARLVQKSPQLVRRIEVEPGEEAQIDFGTAAFIKTTDGKRRRPWVLRVVLSHSRKAYSEVVYQQSTENFIRVLENAFRYFGGVPRKLVIDNLKAAVKQADWYDPEVHPKLQSFAQHVTVHGPVRKN